MEPEAQIREVIKQLQLTSEKTDQPDIQASLNRGSESLENALESLGDRTEKTDPTEKDSITLQIAQARADAKDIDPEELDESLENFVSTDAIRDLVAHECNSWRLQFETQDCVIEVMGDDTILVNGEEMEPSH